MGIILLFCGHLFFLTGWLENWLGACGVRVGLQRMLHSVQSRDAAVTVSSVGTS